jgi:hypothetical protein
VSLIFGSWKKSFGVFLADIICMLIPFVIRGSLFSELVSVETIGCAQHHIHFITGRPAFKLYQFQAAVPVKNSLIDMYRSDICAGIHTEAPNRLGKNGILRLLIG